MIDGAPPDPGPPDEALSTLRGARTTTVDARRAGRVVGAICMVALAVTGVILLVAGADKNAQITRLRTHGVAVAVRVTGCQGLLGGSGSNAAGYACQGTYTVHGKRYSQNIPGDVVRAPGSIVRGVADPGDPGLLSTAADVASQRASWTVFVVPGVLLLVVALAVAAALVRQRRARRA